MRLISRLIFLVLLLLITSAAHAQAFLPAKGSGSISIDVGTAHSAGHFMDDGSKLPGYGSRANHITLSAEYGLTHKLAVGFTAPYIRSKYTGKEEPLNLPANVVDDGVYHGTVQDLRFEGRYNILQRPVMMTPFFAVSVPSHHYETIGESSVGPDLRQITTGVYAGRLLNPIVSRAFVHGSYSYTAVQKILDLSLNRSNIDFSTGYFITPTLSASFLWRRQWTHGGLNFAEIYSTTSSDVFLQQDRLTRQDFQHIGAGMGLSLTESVSVDFSFVKFVSGHNAHFGEGLSGGITWSFSRPESALP